MTLKSNRTNKRKRLIIEFNGLPGAGKTTISDEFINSKVNSNIKIYSYSYFQQDNVIKEYLRFVIVLLKPSNFLIGIYSIMFLIKNKRPDIESLKRILLLIRLVESYRSLSGIKTPEIVVVDQGIIQQITSILFGNKIKCSKYIRKLLLFLQHRLDNVYFINVTISLDQAINRMNNREKKKDRIQNVETEREVQILTMLNYNLSKIRSILSNVGYEPFELNSHKEVKYNINLLNNYVINLLK